MINTSLLQYIYLTARRDWLFAGIYMLIFFMLLLSIFFGSTTLVEQNLTTSVFIAGSTRVVVIFGLTLFCCFHIKRGFDNKEIEMFLTKPITREQFVIYYFLGMAFLACAIVVPLVALSVMFLKLGVLWGNANGFILWGLSLLLESFIMIAFALFAALTLESAISTVLLCFAFYVFSRIFGYFLISLHNPVSLSTGFLSEYYKQILWWIGMLVPRLDMFADSEWMIYGVQNTKEYLIFNGSALVYILFLLAMAIYDFRRREF